METKNNDGFSYTYSAKEQEEIKRIRQKYTKGNKEEDKMERLRRLDAGVTRKAQTVSLIFGVVGTLILGVGARTDLAMPLGILIGLLGGVLACLAYPLYHIIIKRERKKIAPEILRLTDELMK